MVDMFTPKVEPAGGFKNVGTVVKKYDPSSIGQGEAKDRKIPEAQKPGKKVAHGGTPFPNKPSHKPPIKKKSVPKPISKPSGVVPKGYK